MTHEWDALNAAATERLRALAAGLTTADFDRAEDGWPLSAILCHLAFWDRRGRFVLEAWDRGEVAPRPDDDFYDSHVLNEALIAEWRAVPGVGAARLAVEAADAIDRVVAGLQPSTVDTVAALDELWRLRRHNHRLEHVEQMARLITR